MRIKTDDLSGAEIAQLLATHLDFASENSPPESTHVLDLSGLRQPEITFWSAWEGRNLLGCVALKKLGQSHGEILGNPGAV